MSRRRKILVAVCVAIVALAAVGLWALPHALRRAAVDQLAALSGRATSIDDVDLNVFTGRFAVTRLRMARRPGHGSDAFVEFERLEGRIAPLALLRSEFRLVELRLSRPAVRITRTGPFNFDVSDLLQLFVRPVAKEEEKSRWVFSLGRFELTGGTVVIDDAFLSPPRQWRLEDLGFEASELSTAETAGPGRLKAAARLGDARLDVASQSLKLSPFRVSLDVALKDFDLSRIRPYLPPDAPASPETGKLTLALKLDRVRAGQALAESSVSGEIRLDGLSVVQRDRTDPFLRLGRLVLVLKRMDFLGEQIEVAGIDAEGLDLKMARDENGDLDLLAALRPTAPAEAPALPDDGQPGAAGTDRAVDARASSTKPGESEPQAPPPSTGPPAAPRAPPAPVKFGKVIVDRVSVRSGVITATDRAVSPGREWRIDDLTVDGAGLGTSPEQAAGSLQLRAQVSAGPGSARPARLAVDANGVRLVPLAATARVTLEDFALAGVEPYWPEALPAVAREGVVGASLAVNVAQGDTGLSQATASGNIGLDGLSVVRRGQQPAFLKIRKVAVGIRQADAVARSVALGTVSIEGPDLKMRRTADGQIDLLTMMAAGEPAPGAGTSPTETNRAAPKPQTGSLSTPPAAPGTTRIPTVVVDRLSVRSGTVTAVDDAVSPGREWKIGDLTVDGAALSTSSGDAPGTLQVRAQVSARPGSSGPARLRVDASGVRLAPAAASARIALDGLSLADAEPYWPQTLPVAAPEGVVGASLSVSVAHGDTGLTRAGASGTVRVERLGVVRRGQPSPFLRVPKLAIDITQADAVGRSIALGSVEIEGADLTAKRDEKGEIDVLTMMAGAEPVLEEAKVRTGLASQARAPQAASPSAAPGPPQAAPPPASTAGWRLTLDRFAFSKGTLTFDDRAVSPAARLALGDVKLTAERISWPFTSPGTFSFLVSMPGGGWTYGKGTAMLEPLNVQVSLSTRDTPIDRYQTYFPFPAQLEAQFNGDSLSEVQRGPQGELILASRGTAWANVIRIRAPGASDPVVSSDSMVIQGIDFSWPNYALVQRVVFARPRALVERDEQGRVNLRQLFEVPDGEGETPTPPASAASPPTPAPPPPVAASPSGASASEAPAPSAPARRAGGNAVERSPSEGSPAERTPVEGGAIDGSPAEDGLIQQIVIDFGEIRLRDGFVRFVDKTLSPPFAEDISRLSLTLTDLSNILGRPQRTTMTAQGLLGVDGALDMRGQLSGIGETLRGDLVAELRDYSLPTASPYMESVTSWAVQSGRLQAKIHYQIEGDRITAQHDLELKGLRVQKVGGSDEAKQRIGIPLGLAVALLKDSRGDIDLTLPISGTLSDRQFNWADAMWAAVKQVVAKVVLSPFRAIGRLFTGGDDTVDKLEINPVTFAPGSAVIAPSLEAQITKVADFLKQSPYVKVTLAPVTTAADADSLKSREVRRRVETLRREQSLPDLESALRLYYQQRVSDAVLPKTTEEQLALLAEREPVPQQRLAELGSRRLESVRDSLVKGRGIAAERVMVPPPAGAQTTAAGGDGQGRVEFTIVAAEG